MKPYIKSQKLQEEKGIGWQQAGNDISYTPSTIRYGAMTFEEENPEKRYFKLTFSYTFSYVEDEVMFALCIPYTYTQLLRLIENLKATAALEESKL